MTGEQAKEIIVRLQERISHLKITANRFPGLIPQIDAGIHEINAAIEIIKEVINDK